MNSKEVVKLEDVWAYYDSSPVLRGVDLSLAAGRFLGIIGPNGGGKTTLLKIILGLIKPSRGQVWVLGQTPERSRKFAGYVAQYNLFDRDFPINVEEVVLMGRYRRRGLLRRYSREDRSKVSRILEKVGMLDFKDRQIGSLSGGEQQRVFVARALVSEPTVLLLDEPTASIAPDMQVEFYELLDKLKEQMAIILVSHDVSAVSVHVDEVACLNNRLFYHGSPEGLSAEELARTYDSPVHIIAHSDIPHQAPKDQ
jgi:zinc transport system ATP-binding protein